MVQFKAIFDKNIVPDRKVKFSVSGNPENLISIWAGKGLLATIAEENIIRLWNLKYDENYNLGFANTILEDRIINEVFNNLSFNSNTQTLCAVTNAGKIVFFRNRLGNLVPKNETHWDIINLYIPTEKISNTIITWSN